MNRCIICGEPAALGLREFRLASVPGTLGACGTCQPMVQRLMDTGDASVLPDGPLLRILQTQRQVEEAMVINGIVKWCMSVGATIEHIDNRCRLSIGGKSAEAANLIEAAILWRQESPDAPEGA